MTARALLLALATALGAAAWAQPATPGGTVPATATPALPAWGQDDDASQLNLLLFQLRLDNQTLADDFIAYELQDELLLPLGELARLLTLGITVDPRSRIASGFVLREDRLFRLEPQSETVVSEGVRQPVERRLLRWIDGDLYVPARLLQQWLPLGLLVDRNTLTLAVAPRERLPIQARLERERLAGRLGRRGGASDVDRGYPRAAPDYRLASVPFIDQTLGLQVNGGNGNQSSSWAYSAFVTGDLLGMEASAYVSSSSSRTRPDARLTLQRHDPDATLLGPLRARSVALGQVSLPALSNVLRGSSGDGLVLGNRPLNQPSSYGLQTFRGDLPPGWDVTLYFNDALIAFQTSRPDGLYEFADQPLVYGVNEFVLVFNGPLGQTRVERQTFILDQTLTRPGEWTYQLGSVRGANGGQRSSLLLEAGLRDNLAGSAAWVQLPGATPAAAAQDYLQLGLRASTLGMLLSGQWVQGPQATNLLELGLRTRLGRFALDLTHTTVGDGFVSDTFAASSDPVASRLRARISGSVPLGERLRLPLGLDLRQDRSRAGLRSDGASARLSLNLLGTSFTQSFDYSANDTLAGGRNSSLTGALQLSRRVAGIGLSGQLAQQWRPQRQISSVAISADKNFSDTTRMNLGVLHSVASRVTSYSAGLNHRFGHLGVGVSGRVSSTGDWGLGVQLFMALGRDPHSGRWRADWQPMAAAGAVSARAWVDANGNGLFDADEEPVQNACFGLNGGSRHPSCTDADGLAYLSRLSPRAYLDLALDAATLEDPQWVPTQPGVRLLPRPGKVLALDFPVVLTGEIDGTVFLQDGGRTRGIGNALLELVDAQGEVVASTRSASDGYYIVPAVRPGSYRLRVSPEQLQSLGLQPVAEQAIRMNADGDFLNGVDFTLQTRAAP